MAITLFVIVALAALLFGAVEHWSLAAVGIATAAAFIWFALTANEGGRSLKGMPWMVGASLAIISYPALQLIPLPLGLLDVVHPGLKDLVTLAPGAPPAFHSISIYPYATIMDAAKVLLYVMVFWMAAYGLRDSADASRLIKALAVFGFILTVFGLIQKALWTGSIYWIRELTQGGSPFGPFVNRNHFAGFVGMIVPLTLGVALRTRTVEKKAVFAFLAVIMVVGLFFSLSRGGMASFVGGMLVFGVIVFARSYSITKLIPIGLFLIVIVAYLIFLGIGPIEKRFAESGVSDTGRLLAWEATLVAFTDFPVFGSGLGTFQYVFNVYRPEALHGELLWDHAHNDYLELLLEGGIVGLVLFGAFFFLVLRRIMTHRWRGSEAYLQAGILGSVATMAIHGAADFNLHIPSNAILLALVLGLGISLTRHREGGFGLSAEEPVDEPEEVRREISFDWKKLGAIAKERRRKRSL